MYRKPLLFPEDLEALLGKVVRLEWSSFPPKVGVCVKAEPRRVILRQLDGSATDLYCINAAYVVFATTESPRDNEDRFVPVFWRDRSTIQTY